MRSLVYLWALPTTAVGLALGALALVSGGGVRRRAGTLEFHGGWLGAILAATPAGATAMTVGHVILGRHEAGLDRCRSHELVHVRQAELLGPLFIPAYFAASAWAAARGRHLYRDNWFEVDARRRSEDVTLTDA
ncbi:MAG: hypothetical protein GC160_05865 [Acidobacteria bacterium]|nr:hypothetical protein [Acidobacteriota bacterium]